MVEQRPLATPDQVAIFLGVTERTLETWRYRKTGPRWAPVGRHVRYRWSDVERWFDEQVKAAVA